MMMNKDDGAGGDNWNYKTWKAPVKLSLPVYWSLVLFYLTARPNAVDYILPPPVLWHSWLGDRKGIWPVRTRPQQFPVQPNLE